MRKIVEAEIVSEKGALCITLTNPEILDGKEWPVIEGYSWGIEPDFDEEGEELDNDVLVVDAYYPKAYFRLRDEDIAKVEVALRFQKSMGEIDDIADGLYCVAPAEEDRKVFDGHARECMRKLDLYWMSNPDWYDYIPIVRHDAPAEAKASFEHYLEQRERPISELRLKREGHTKEVPLTDKEKIAVYEVFIEDMLHVFQKRLDELCKNGKNLTEYEKGRWMGYWEILDIIQTRSELITEMLDGKSGV